MLAGEQVRRGEQRALPSRLCRGQPLSSDRRLARPDIPLEEAEHRRVAGQVDPQGVDRGGLVRCRGRGPPTFAASASTIAADRGIGLVGHLDPWRRVPSPLAAPPDHPDLQGEQLVEGEPPQGGIPRLECRRVVGILEGVDQREPFRLADRGRQVFRVLVAGTIERLADRRSQPCRRSNRRRRVGHDPPGVEHLGVALGDLELGVVG